MPISNCYLAAELLKLFEHLRIDLHHVKRLAHYVELGNARSKSIGVGIEDIEFVALDDVNNAAAGDRLEARYVKVLAERRLWRKSGGGCAGLKILRQPRTVFAAEPGSTVHRVAPT